MRTGLAVGLALAVGLVIVGAVALGLVAAFFRGLAVIFSWAAEAV